MALYAAAKSRQLMAIAQSLPTYRQQLSNKENPEQTR
jgi:hypothetical protein